MESTTSRGQNPHRLTTSKVPRMQIFFINEESWVDTNRVQKPTTFQHDGFCHSLLHPKSLFVSPNTKKSCFNLLYFIPSKKKLSFCNQKKKTSAPKMVHHQCFSFSPYPPLKQHESEKVLKSKPKGLCGKITCTELVWLQSEDHPTNQVSL